MIGRFSSLWLTLVGGLVIGVLQTLASAWEPITAYATIVPFLIATVVILIGRRRVLTIGVVRS